MPIFMWIMVFNGDNKETVVWKECRGTQVDVVVTIDLPTFYEFCRI